MNGKVVLDPPYLDEDERALIESLDLDALDLGSADEIEARRAELQQIAANTINPPKVQISARLSKHDLSKLRAIAMRKGIPYQTLLGSIVHQYVEGHLKEVE